MPETGNQIVKKTMEYPDSPSGYVTLYNYKEPFVPIEKGYGYFGVLLFDGEKDNVQCHLCGTWVHYLPNHLHKEHAMKAKEYKEKVGLRPSTALISETIRKRLVQTHLDIRKKNLKKGVPKTDEIKEKIRQTLKNKTWESQNERGTCPAQILERIRKLADKLGRTPTTNEATFYQTAQEVFGSWKKAVKMAGLIPRKSGEVTEEGRKNQVAATRYSDDFLLSLLHNFIEKNNRLPSGSDFRRKLLPSLRLYYKRFGGLKATMKRLNIVLKE